MAVSLVIGPTKCKFSMKSRVLSVLNGFRTEFGLRVQEFESATHFGSRKVQLNAKLISETDLRCKSVEFPGERHVRNFAIFGRREWPSIQAGRAETMVDGLPRAYSLGREFGF